MPRLIDHAEREVAVAEAAWRVLRDKGMRGVSVRNVAAEAGLATGSLRRSFPTQAALLAYCIELVGERAEARIRALPENPDPIEYAVDVVAQALPLDADRRIEMEVWLVMSSAALADAALRPACARIDESIATMSEQIIRDLAGARLINRDRDLAYEAQRLYAVIDGLAVHLLKRPPEDEVSWAYALLRRHLRGLSTADKG